MRGSRLLLAMGIVALTCSGCGKKEKIELEPVSINPYERITYETVEVMQGDMMPVLEMHLSQNREEFTKYSPMKDQMEVDQVFVKSGDIVEKGEVLVTFKSGDLEDQLRGYQDQLSQSQLLLEHYQRLAKIDKQNNYKDDIKMLKKDIEVAAQYVAETTAKINSYQIIAEANGEVVSVSDLLFVGPVNTADIVITLMYGENHYFCSTDSDYDFKIGEIYTARGEMSTYEMELLAVEEEDGEKTLELKPYGLTGTISETALTLVVETEMKKDTMYLPRECVIEKDGMYFVYIMDNGFKIGKVVEVGEIVGENIIIKSGINVGDKVVISDET